MKITIDSKQEKGIERFEPGVLYWHVPTGVVCVPTYLYGYNMGGSYGHGVGFNNDGIIVTDWHFCAPSNYRKFNGVVKLSNK